MEWKEEYSVGLVEIDRQHKELVSLFGRIEEALQAHLDWSELHYRVVELRNFATLHFEFEEGVMRMFAFPSTESHAWAHQLFFVKLSEIERRIVQGDGCERDMIKFLFDWLFQHVMKSDRDYVEHILAGAAPVRSWSI